MKINLKTTKKVDSLARFDYSTVSSEGCYFCYYCMYRSMCIMIYSDDDEDLLCYCFDSLHTSIVVNPFVRNRNHSWTDFSMSYTSSLRSSDGSLLAIVLLVSTGWRSLLHGYERWLCMPIVRFLISSQIVKQDLLPQRCFLASNEPWCIVDSCER